MTTEQLFKAVVEGLVEEGVAAQHVSAGNGGHLMLVTINRKQYQLFLWEERASLKRVGKMTHPWPGPELNDPEFFKKLRILVETIGASEDKEPPRW